MIGCAAEAGGLIASATDMIEASKESLMNLTALRAEQARLRAEYEKMEVCHSALIPLSFLTSGFSAVVYFQRSF